MTEDLKMMLKEEFDAVGNDKLEIAKLYAEIRMELDKQLDKQLEVLLYEN